MYSNRCIQALQDATAADILLLISCCILRSQAAPGPNEAPGGPNEAEEIKKRRGRRATSSAKGIKCQKYCSLLIFFGGVKIC